ncbi:MAG: hypothetical protein IKY59_04730 [Oscillospiraceae bacterium]|nr:hypothetical protein [Oscillospiraceae bacterium]
MTSKIIYHDFRSNTTPTATEPTPKVSLTAAVLTKGRRLAAINNALNVTCVALCGACIGVSLLILTTLFLG